MSVNSVWISCGAAVSGVSVKQHGHLTSLQLNTLNHSTMQSALHGSSIGWCKILRHMGHCSCSKIAGLLELASKWSSSIPYPGGGAIAGNEFSVGSVRLDDHMVVMI